MVYYIQAKDGGRIKIGYAEFPASRLKRLQMGSPVELILIAVQEGNHLTEKMIHNEFRHSRAHFEWFENTDELADYIKSNAILVADLNQEKVLKLEKRADNGRIIY
ncbi:MAG: hypothetical protein E3J58_05590 [Actinomycetota bacterium]|nr:MAG: hypothetical protein E3J58_05590 [Actinomycetota bacterium]